MKTVSERFLTGAMYAPFCRTKHAPMEEWDADMAKMAQLGYTCLHGFAEWHDIEYEKGVFDFTKIDHFVACAVKNGLVPIINVATQNSVGFYSPRWLMEELRGNSEGVVDSLGTSPYPGEYVIPCMDDPLYHGYAVRYLEAVAKHFAGDERVGAFVLWGEPTLKSVSADSNAMICYCRHTRAKFRRWLAGRYGSIVALNASWGNEGPSFYADFDGVNPPTGYRRQKGGFQSWDDWCDFMESDLAGHIAEADRIFKANGALQPTITEMLPGIDNGIDSWKLAENTDIVGVSLFGKPTKHSALNLTVSSSIARANGKSVFIVEAGGGSVKFDNPGGFAVSAFTPSVAELKTALMMRAGFGARGLMYWCWRPRLSDIEGNDFGMCRPDGKPLRRTVEVGAFARRMTELSPVYAKAERRSDVAVFMSQRINHLMDGDNMTANYLGSLTGANYMLGDLHINSDFIREDEIIAGALSRYKVLILPCSYIISEECGSAIIEFVRNGGHVIADYILAEKRPGGLCYRDLPGAGLSEVFGIEREDVLYTAHPALVRENSFGIGVGTFVEEVIPTTASSAGGEYLPGYPLLLVNSFGRGSAVYIATQYFLHYNDAPSAGLRARIKDILAGWCVTPYASFAAEDRRDSHPLITTCLTGGATVISVTNSDYPVLTDTVELPDGEWQSVDSASRLNIRHENGRAYIDFTLGALETFAVYCE